MKNIAILVPCLYGGGAERIAGLLSKYLSSKYNVFVFVVDVENINYEYAGELVDLSINGEENIRFNIIEYKREYNIDCAISFLEPMNFLNILTKGKEKIIISERCSLSPEGALSIGDLIKVKRLYNYADRIVSVAYGVEHNLVNNFGIRKNIVNTIYNFINKEDIVRKSLLPIDDDIRSFMGNSKIILNVGRMDKQKNHKKLLIQFSKLVKERKDVKLIIVGKGAQEKEIKKLIGKLGINSLVKLITYNNNPFPLYRIASFMAVTSDYEGLPNVILEAMLLKLPVVAVDCLSGPRELLEEKKDYTYKIEKYKVCKNGILVEQTLSDEDGVTDYYKQAMKLMLDNEKIREQIIINSTKFMNEYDNNKILEQWINVIEDTKTNKKSSNKIEIPELKGCNKLIIYGAGVLGKKTMSQFIMKKDNFELLCFAVSNKDNIADYVCGIPVYEIEELLKYKDEAMVLIGVSNKYEKEIIDILEHYGFRYTFPNV